MKKKINYDTSGLSSSYLALSILIPYCMWTYRSLSAPPTFICRHCKPKPKIRYRKLLLLIIQSICISLLCYKVWTTDQPKSDQFDPFSILQINEGASPNEIKKAYIKLGRKFRRNDDKLKEIGSAYNFIKDGKKYSPQPKDSDEILGIPEVVAANSWIVTSIYIALLIFCLPYYGFMKWRRSVRCNKFGVKYSTVNTFLDLLDQLNYNDHHSYASLLLAIMETEDLGWCSNIKIKKEYIMYMVEEEYCMPVISDSTSYLVALDHLFRLNSAQYDSEKLVTSILRITETILRLSVARNLMSLYRSCLTLQKMVIQRVFDPELPILQFPFVEPADVKNKKALTLDQAIKCCQESKIVNEFKSQLPFIDIISVSIVGGDEFLEGGKAVIHLGAQDSNVLKIGISRCRKNTQDNENTSDDLFILNSRKSEDYDALNARGCYVRTPVHNSCVFLHWRCVFEGGKVQEFAFQDFVGLKYLYVTVDKSESTNYKLSIDSGEYFGLEKTVDIIVNCIK